MVSPRNRNGSPSSSAAAGMSVLKHLYSALDSALDLIETSGGTRRDFAQGINFYDEVRRFEISLIEQALRETGGSQVRAAVLLGLNHTTLNSKIKNYSISLEWVNPFKRRSRTLKVANE